MDALKYISTRSSNNLGNALRILMPDNMKCLCYVINIGLVITKFIMLATDKNYTDPI